MLLQSPASAFFSATPIRIESLERFNCHYCRDYLVPQRLSLRLAALVYLLLVEKRFLKAKKAIQLGYLDPRPAVGPHSDLKGDSVRFS
jgi:hypothetical protein